MWDHYGLSAHQQVQANPRQTGSTLYAVLYLAQYNMPHPTSSTAELLKYASKALDSIFAFGYTFKKTGVMLSNLVPADYRSKGIFTEGPDERLIKLGGVIDKLNYRFGQDKLRLASQIFNPDWPMRQEWLSRRYTTRWDEILVVK